MLISSRFLAIISMLILVMLVACSGNPSPPAASEGPSENNSTKVSSASENKEAEKITLTVAIPFFGEPTDPVGGGFNPIKTGLSETLFKLGRDLKPEPWLATGAEKIDEHTWEIRIREGVKFHNGVVMDADAVKASLERAVGLSATAKAVLDISQVSVKDSLTLLVETNLPSPIFPALLAEPTSGIVEIAAANAMGEAFANQAVLTGPYKVESFRANEELIAVRHDDYWGGRPRVDRLVFKVLADNNSRVLAVQSGDVDIAEYIAPASVSAIADAPSLSVKSATPVALEFIYLDHRKAAWTDLRVRRAIAHSIDRQALADVVLRGRGVQADGPFASSIIQCAGVKGHSFDPDQSRTLLAEAGYLDSDGDGVVEKDGQNLTMVLLTYPQRPELPDIAQVVQASLKDIGIQVEIRSVEGINAALEQGDWDGGLYFNNMAVTGDPYRSLSVFFTTGGSANRGFYSNSEVDESVQRVNQLLEREQRQQQACEASRAIVDDLPVIPLLHPNYSYAVSEKVVGFEEPHPLFLYMIDTNIGK